MKPAARFIVIGLVGIGVCGVAPFASEHPPAGLQTPTAIGFQDPAAEQFLLQGKITEVRELGEGVTRPRKVTLERDGLIHNAVFKWIDERRQGVYRLADGTEEVGFQDTWQTEVAAYRIDRLIGLGMVPATVERRVQGDEGSLQWWVDAAMSEEDRLEEKRNPPDLEAWNRQRLNVWLFDELISNVDRHLSNLLITSDFRIRLIDHSRSFRENQDLRHPERLTAFSQTLLDGLERLTKDGLEAEVGRYLSNAQIERLLARRDAILELARRRIAERGEDVVFYQ
jgi:hypothetical protein